MDEVLLASGFYTACEQLKGGSFFNSRFKGKLSGLGRAPFIIVTANGPPPLGDSVLARCGAMSFDRIEALQISVDQTKVGAHIPTKERLLEIAEKYGLYQNACLGAEVNGLTWDESASAWRVTTDRGAEQ